MRLGSTTARARAFAAVLAAGLLVLAAAPAQAAGPASSGSPAPTAGRTPAAPATTDLPASVAVTAVSPQVLEPGEDLTVTATIRNDGTEIMESPRASVRIYRYRMSSREQLSAWAEAGTSSPIGDVAATTTLEEPLAPGTSATVSVVVPADDIRLLRTDDAWGPRGITLDVWDGASRVGLDRTFLIWSSTDHLPTTQVGVLSAVVGPAAEPSAAAATPGAAAPATTAPTATPAPTATSDGTDGDPGDPGDAGAGTDGAGPDDGATLDEGVLTALTGSNGRLGRVLQATGSFPFVSWAVDPALVDEASTGSGSARAWLAGMEDAAGGREVLRLPWADPDLAAVAHAGGADPTTDLLRLAGAVTGGTEDSPLWSGASDVLWAADDVPDQVTATRAATSAPGVPLVVGATALPSTGTGTPSAPVTVPTEAGAVTALVPDATLSSLLSAPAATQPGVTPATAAQRVLAETAVLARAADASSTFVLATTPRDWEPSTAITTAQLKALSTAPWVDTVSVADVLTADAAGLADGDGARRDELPASERAGSELTPAWVNALSGDWRAATEFAAVVPDPAALLEGLDADLVAPLAVAWRADPDGRAAAVEQARARAVERQTGLSVLLNEQFTVVSSSAQITVAVRNTLDQPADVRVELRPRKGCLDTARSDMTTVAAEAETSVTLTLHATANCDVVVDVSLVSQSGRELVTPVAFSARVAPTIESVGGVVVGVLLALVLTFGIWRTVRRGQTARRGARVLAEGENGAGPDGPGTPADDAPEPTDGSPSGRQDPS
jgi:hypothetical protein